jgi:hypothetical protein
LQPHQAFEAAGGQGSPVRAECHRSHVAGAAGQGDPSVVGWAGSATFHNWTVPSSPTVARAGPPGLNTRELTPAGSAGNCLRRVG